jgi:SAM-dependent methyltransferase
MSNFEAARSFAAFGLRERAAGRRESASGPGSARAAAEPALRLLRRTLKERDIRSILDLGCGDWNWMRDLGLPDPGLGQRISYEGWEANADLVQELTTRFGKAEEIVFALRDATTEPLPRVDLIIARDLLFHLPTALAASLVARIRTNCRYLLSTSFPATQQNGDIQPYLPIEGWGFHRINLDLPPFGLADHLEEAVEEPLCAHRGMRRFFCLYAFQ